jgi:hypothetical protein
MYEEYGITQEEYENILNEYGEVNEDTIRDYFSKLSINLSNTIKDEVYENKKETTSFMDKVKTLVFVGLVAGITHKEFNKRLDKEYEEYQKDINKSNAEGYKEIKDIINSSGMAADNENKFEINFDDLLNLFKLDTTSSKTENDKYIRLIKNYYKKTEKTTEYFKTDITLKEYLARRVDKFDKLEKTVAYYNKDGTIRAYFDIASYDSMVYNTNLTRAGVRESIRACEKLRKDVVYVDPHPFACPECQIWQGRFYSLSGITTEFNGEMVLPFEMALEGESGIGLLHPNCSHIIRPAYETDFVSDKYSDEEWEEKYNIKQKIQGMELKKSRLRNDNKIYKELEDQNAIDKNRQKIKSLNEKIKELQNELKNQ